MVPDEGAGWFEANGAAPAELPGVWPGVPLGDGLTAGTVGSSSGRSAIAIVPATGGVIRRPAPIELGSIEASKINPIGARTLTPETPSAGITRSIPSPEDTVTNAVW